MRSVPLIRCLPKMSPSLSTSNGSQIATWRRSLTWTRHDFNHDLRPLFSLNPVQRDILPHRQSQLSDLTIRLHVMTSLKSITQILWLYHQLFKWSFWPVQFCQCQSRDQSFFVLIGQCLLAEASVQIKGAGTFLKVVRPSPPFPSSTLPSLPLPSPPFPHPSPPLEVGTPYCGFNKIKLKR